MVSCAVLPPRLPSGMAPPTGTAVAGAISFDESLNWQHNKAVEEGPVSRRKSLFRKAGLTTQRKRANEEDDLPPFIMRQIPYDTWRKHYAKDKDGNYKGTHAPAEDCLLKPDDVEKWRLGAPVTKADKWTRGSEALPVYAEVRAEGTLPEYQHDSHDDSYIPTIRQSSIPEEDHPIPAYVDVTAGGQETRPPPQEINNPATQARLAVEAASAYGDASGTTTDARVNLSGNANGNFLPIAALSAAPPAGTPVAVAGDGSVRLPAIYNNGVGDFNKVRAQGQVIIDSNRISDVQSTGIWSETAPRQADPEDVAKNVSGNFGNSLFFNRYLIAPFVGANGAGGVINLPTLNDSVTGGLVPGVVIENNIIDQAGFTGIKVDGQTRPLMVETLPDLNPLSACYGYSRVRDGDIVGIDAAGTRVVFEYDDVSTPGGNGVTDGHIPVYFYQCPSTNPYGGTVISSVEEVLVALQQAINSSILVTNDLSELARAYVAPSLLENQSVFQNQSLGLGNPPGIALYVEGASQIYFAGGPFTLSLAPVSEAPQPFARIVNNTIYGSDGTEAKFPGSGASEPNDSINGAVDTKVGRSHSGPYKTQGKLGDNPNSLAADRDVDLYRVELGAGDRLAVDIDTLAGGPNTILRLFDSNGVPQTFISGGGATKTTTFSLPGAIPTYLNPGSTNANPQADQTNGNDGFIDFTATKAGTYYVGVSSVGNDEYDPLSLSGRKQGTGGTGDYSLGIEVYAPRSFVLSVDNGGGKTFGAALIGTTFTITQIPDFTGALASIATGNQLTFEFTTGAGLVNGHIGIPLLDNYRVRTLFEELALPSEVNCQTMLEARGQAVVAALWDP